MKISIVTPSYNQVQFLERTIQSVLNQQGDFELEYIIIDGGSTDQSVDLIKQYAAKDSRITWVSEKDRGQSDAINKGLRMTTGDIVAFLNSDDVYAPGALQQVVQAFQAQPDAQWLYGHCRIIDTSDREVRGWITTYKNILLKKFRFWLFLIVNYISQPATFWRQELLDAVGFFDETDHLAMDYEYWCRVGSRYQPIVLPSVLADFRVHDEAKTKQFFVQRLQLERLIANRYTRNPLIRFLHWAHTMANIVVYRLWY